MKNSFRKNGFFVYKNILNKQLIEYLQINFSLLRELSYLNLNSETHDKYYFGDVQVKKSFSMYSPSCFEPLLVQLLPLVEKITSLQLYPCYSFGRIYYNDSFLEKHVDRPSCEISATICLKKDIDWDFFIINKENETEKIKLNEGDMCIYSGNELEHWREKYSGEEHMQFFLHYVNRNGKFKKFKNDMRPLLGINKLTDIDINNKYYKYNYL